MVITCSSDVFCLVSTGAISTSIQGTKLHLIIPFILTYQPLENILDFKSSSVLDTNEWTRPFLFFHINREEIPGNQKDFTDSIWKIEHVLDLLPRLKCINPCS